MKVIIKTLIFIMMISFSNLAFASDWIYAGRYVLSNNIPIAPYTDLLLINHLTSYSNRTIGENSYSLYDVYYMHDHESDTGDSAKEYDDRSFRFQAKIVPLDIYGKVMDYSGTKSATIVSDFVIAAKGVFGISPKQHRVYDRKTHEILFEATGAMGGQQLYKDSAAEDILKQSGDHPVFRGASDKLNGSGYND